LTSAILILLTGLHLAKFGNFFLYFILCNFNFDNSVNYDGEFVFNFSLLQRREGKGNKKFDNANLNKCSTADDAASENREEHGKEVKLVKTIRSTPLKQMS